MEKTVAVRLSLLYAQYKAGLADSGRATTQFAATAAAQAGAVGTKMSSIGGTLTRTVTPAATIAALAFAKMGRDYHDGVDALRAGTAATGAQLDELTESMKAVGSSVPISLGRVGEIMADLNTRTGATGDNLENLTKQFAQLEFLGNAASVENVTRVFGDWSIATADQTGALDELFRVSQLTGPTVDALSQKLVQYGAPLREVGYSFEEAALLMGKFEKEGVNTELVMGGLRIALGKFAKAGKDPKAALAEVMAEIERLGPGAESTGLAMQTFGQRAGVDMARAILEGRFSLDEMNAALAENGDTINAAAEDNTHLMDRVKMLTNTLTGALGPLGDLGMVIFGVAAAAGPAAKGVGLMLTGFSKLPAALMSAKASLVEFATTHATLTSAIAAGGIVVVGAVAAWKLWENQIHSTDDQVKGITDRLNEVRMTGNFDEILAKVGDINEQIQVINDEKANANPFFDADYITQLDNAGKAIQQQGEHMMELLRTAEEYSKQTGITRDEVLAWLQAEEAAGRTYSSSQAAIAALTGATGDYEMSAEDATNAAASQADAIKEAADAARAAVDPYFAAVKAEQSLAAAKQATSDAIAEHGRDSEEVRQAMLNEAAAGFDLSSSYASIAEQMKRNGLGAEEAAGYLADLAEQGIITRDTAYEIATQFAETGNKAEASASQAERAVAALNGELYTTSQGAIGIVATPGADESERQVRDVNGELHTVKEGAAGSVTVPGADGATYQVMLVNGQLSAVRVGASGHVQVTGTEAAAAALDSILTRVDRIKGTIAVGLAGGPKAAQKNNAAGGFIPPFGVSEVNEPYGKRPEMFTIGGRDFLAAGSEGVYVKSHAATFAAAGSSGGGGTTVIVDMPVSASFPRYVGSQADLRREVQQIIRESHRDVEKAVRKALGGG